MPTLLRRLIPCLLLLLLTAAGPLRADGTADFTDPLASESSTSKWRDPANTGWHNDGPTYCYGRQAGIGLRKANIDGPTTGIRRTFDPPEPIRDIVLTCTASADSAFTGKRLPLQLTLIPADPTQPPIIEAQYITLSPRQRTDNIAFILPAPLPVTAIRLDSLSEDEIIILSDITWRQDTLPITFRADIHHDAFCGAPFRIALASITGGNGNYSAEIDAFGSHYTPAISPDTYPTLDLTAPDTPGTYPITLTIRDSDGKSATRTYNITIQEDRTPPTPTVSHITATGFLLSWPPYPDNVKKYEITLIAENLPESATFRLPPANNWTLTDGFYTTDFDLTPYAATLRLTAATLSYDTPYTNHTTPEYRYNQPTWTPALSNLPELSLLFTDGRDRVPNTFTLRIPADQPLPQGHINFLFSPAINETQFVSPNATSLQYTDLPRGLDLRILFTVHCHNPIPGAPTLLYRALEDLRLSLAPFTSFNNIRLSPDERTVRLFWPGPLSDFTHCTGTITFNARLSADIPPAQPPLRFTGTAYIRGGSPSKTHKFYAFTNLGPTPITPANEGYTLTAINAKGTPTSPWRFTPTRSSPDAGQTYTIGPGETLVFCAGKNMPENLGEHPLARPGEPSALTVGPGATLTLTHNDTPVGLPLPLTKNTLVRCLPSDTTPATLPLATPNDAIALFPPTIPLPTAATLHPLDTYTIPNTHPSYDIPFAPILLQAQTLATQHNLPLVEIIAETTIREGPFSAPSTTFTLWPASPLRPGFLLQIR